MAQDDELAAWIDRHGPALVLYARQTVGDHSAAEDVVQEAFVRFWKHRSRAQHVVAYLYATVRRTALDWQRGERRRYAREQAVAAERDRVTLPAFAVPSEQAERRAAVEAALAKLPVAQREILVMRIWGNLKFAQIALAMGLSVNTVTSRYRYALDNLRRALNKESLL